MIKVKFLTVAEVSEQLKVGRDHVRHLIRTGKLCAKKLGGVGGDYLIHPVDVARLEILRTSYAASQDPLSPDMLWVTTSCNFLVQRMLAGNFRPKQVIGVAHGGLVPASYISTTLKAKLIVLGMQHYIGKRILAEVYSECDYSELPDVPTLVVDDITDSGGTLTVANQLAQGLGISSGNLRSAVLHMKSGTTFTPDWFVAPVDDWVCYPWEQQP